MSEKRKKRLSYFFGRRPNSNSYAWMKNSSSEFDFSDFRDRSTHLCTVHHTPVYINIYTNTNTIPYNITTAFVFLRERDEPVTGLHISTQFYVHITVPRHRYFLDAVRRARFELDVIYARAGEAPARRGHVYGPAAADIGRTAAVAPMTHILLPCQDARARAWQSPPHCVSGNERFFIFFFFC